VKVFNPALRFASSGTLKFSGEAPTAQPFFYHSAFAVLAQLKASGRNRKEETTPRILFLKRENFQKYVLEETGRRKFIVTFNACSFWRNAISNQNTVFLEEHSPWNLLAFELVAQYLLTFENSEGCHKASTVLSGTTIVLNEVISLPLRRSSVLNFEYNYKYYSHCPQGTWHEFFTTYCF
jgi:hypothetical protein